MKMKKEMLKLDLVHPNGQDCSKKPSQKMVMRVQTQTNNFQPTHLNSVIAYTIMMQ